MVEIVFQMYTDDNYKNLEESSSVLFLGTSHKMKGFVSFLTEVTCVGLIYLCSTTMGKAHTNISVIQNHLLFK